MERKVIGTYVLLAYQCTYRRMLADNAVRRSGTWFVSTGAKAVPESEMNARFSGGIRLQRSANLDGKPSWYQIKPNFLKDVCRLSINGVELPWEYDDGQAAVVVV